MTTYRVTLLNPKAGKLLQDLADLDLITIEETASDCFLAAVTRLRGKILANPPTPAQITCEVETVRTKRYAKGEA